MLARDDTTQRNRICSPGIIVASMQQISTAHSMATSEIPLPSGAYSAATNEEHQAVPKLFSRKAAAQCANKPDGHGRFKQDSDEFARSRVEYVANRTLSMDHSMGKAAEHKFVGGDVRITRGKKPHFRKGDIAEAEASVWDIETTPKPILPK